MFIKVKRILHDDKNGCIGTLLIPCIFMAVLFLGMQYDKHKYINSLNGLEIYTAVEGDLLEIPNIQTPIVLVQSAKNIVLANYDEVNKKLGEPHEYDIYMLEDIDLAIDFDISIKIHIVSRTHGGIRYAITSYE